MKNIQEYSERIIKGELKRLKEAIENSKTEPERNFWQNRYNVQKQDFADALLKMIETN